MEQCAAIVRFRAVLSTKTATRDCETSRVLFVNPRTGMSLNQADNDEQGSGLVELSSLTLWCSSRDATSLAGCQRAMTRVGVEQNDGGADSLS
jgi:hypothetical protein